MGAKAGGGVMEVEGGAVWWLGGRMERMCAWKEVTTWWTTVAKAELKKYEAKASPWSKARI